MGSVAGGILGARLGIEAIPVSWIEALKEREKLEEMVEPLLEKYLQVSKNKNQISKRLSLKVEVLKWISSEKGIYCLVFENEACN